MSAGGSPPLKATPVRSMGAERIMRTVVHIDLLTLKLVVAVVEEQSLAKAAEREHIAASAVSKRIADLEKAVKVQLFRRQRTGVQPTPAGHAFLHHARVLMRDLAQMDSEVGDWAQGVRGSLRVFANNSAMVQYLPGHLSRFLALHPLIQVALDEGISPAIVRGVADGTAEIGIFGGNVAAPGLRPVPRRPGPLGPRLHAEPRAGPERPQRRHGELGRSL